MAPPYTYPVAGIVYFATHPQVKGITRKRRNMRLTTFSYCTLAVGQSIMSISTHTHLWHHLLGALLCLSITATSTCTHCRQMSSLASLDSVGYIRLVGISCIWFDILCGSHGIYAGRFVWCNTQSKRIRTHVYKPGTCFRYETLLSWSILGLSITVDSRAGSSVCIDHHCSVTFDPCCRYIYCVLYQWLGSMVGVWHHFLMIEMTTNASW